MVEESKPLLVITGVTGFLGSQILLTCLKEDKWKVRGTVRDIEKAKKALKPALGELFNSVELVVADLLDPDSINKAMNSATFVIHSAAPMPIDFPKRFEEVSKATVDGTLSVLAACKQNGVKRLIFTSHYGAMNHLDEVDRPDLFIEDTWSDPKQPNFQHIHKAKFLAEKATQDFDKGLEVVSLVPTLLVGSSLVPDRVNQSSAFLQRMLKNQLQGMYRIQWGLCDVRDVARAHALALSAPSAANQRIIINSSSKWCREIGLMLQQEYDIKFNTEEVKFCFMKFLGSFFSGEDAEMAAYKNIWGKEQEYSNQKSKDVLGMEYTDVDQSLKDQVR